jgi:hypothetical protein
MPTSASVLQPASTVRRSAAKLLTEQVQTSLHACLDEAERLAR